MNFSVLTLFLLSICSCYGAEKYPFDRFSKETREEFNGFFSPDYLLKKDENRVSQSANLRLRKLLDANLKEARSLLNLNLNLISWPTEDKLFYKYGDIILKDRN